MKFCILREAVKLENAKSWQICKKLAKKGKTMLCIEKGVVDTAKVREGGEKITK